MLLLVRDDGYDSFCGTYEGTATYGPSSGVVEEYRAVPCVSEMGAQYTLDYTGYSERNSFGPTLRVPTQEDKPKSQWKPW